MTTIVQATTAEELPKVRSINTEEEYIKLQEITEFLKEYGVYILASIEGKGTYVGKFTNISLDTDNFPIIECDIEKESVTK